MSIEKIKYYNSNEIKKILSKQLKNKNYNYYLLCLTLAYTGARVSEVLELRKKDIVEIPNSETGESEYYLKLITLKHRKPTYRHIPLHHKLQSELSSYVLLKKLRSKEKLFDISRKTAFNWVKKACALVNLDDGRAHPHTFRHSFGIAVMMKKDIKLRVLQKWLGHAKIESTLIYQDIIASDTKDFMKDFDY
jgi:integrase